MLATADATEVHNSADLERLNQLPLLIWSPSAKPIWLQIEPTTLTGRRILPHSGE